VNLVGSLLLGALLAEESAHPSARLALHDAGAIGFCGGLTTFSTFAVEIVDLVRDDRVGTAAVYGVLSVVGAVGGVVVGAWLLRRVRAGALPLEEQP
jgi:CrcB protein